MPASIVLTDGDITHPEHLVIEFGRDMLIGLPRRHNQSFRMAKKPIREPQNVLYRIQRGLSGYVSYLAACEMNSTFTEYMLRQR